MMAWAGKNCPNTKIVRHILENKTHPEQGFRSCLGIIRLGRLYSAKVYKQPVSWPCRSKATVIKASSRSSNPSSTKKGSIDQLNDFTRKARCTSQYLGRKITTKTINGKGITMLNQQTIEKLTALRLNGMAEALYNRSNEK